MSGHEGCRGFGDKPSSTCSDRNTSLLGRGKRETEAAGPRQTSSCKSDSWHEGSAVGRYLNSGVSKQRSAHIGHLYLQAQSHPRSPPLVASPYEGTQEISVPLPSHGPGIWLVLCKQVRKKESLQEKKQKQKPSLEEPSRLGSPGCLPLSSDGNLLPPFSSLLDRRPEAVHRFWTQQLKVQQGYESNREGALSLSITGQWRRGCPLRSWAGKAQGLRETRQHF